MRAVLCSREPRAGLTSGAELGGASKLILEYLSAFPQNQKTRTAVIQGLGPVEHTSTSLGLAFGLKLFWWCKTDWLSPQAPLKLQ